MRHTKIVATLGPASDTDAVLDELVAAGVDIVRLNFSHGTHETHRASFERIRRAAGRAGRHVAILQDLGGPKIRTGALDGGRPIPLAIGETLRLVTGDGVGHGRAEGATGRAAAATVFTTYAGLAASVHPGDRLLLDDGHVELSVEATTGTEITAREYCNLHGLWKN